MGNFTVIKLNQISAFRGIPVNLTVKSGLPSNQSLVSEIWWALKEERRSLEPSFSPFKLNFLLTLAIKNF